MDAKRVLFLIGKYGPIAFQLLMLVMKIKGTLSEDLTLEVKMKIIMEMICLVLGGFLGGLCGCTLLAQLIDTDTARSFIGRLPGSILQEVVPKVLKGLVNVIGNTLGRVFALSFVKKILNAFQRLHELCRRRQRNNVNNGDNSQPD